MIVPKSLAQDHTPLTLTSSKHSRLKNADRGHQRTLSAKMPLYPKAVELTVAICSLKQGIGLQILRTTTKD